MRCFNCKKPLVIEYETHQRRALIVADQAPFQTAFSSVYTPPYCVACGTPVPHKDLARCGLKHLGKSVPAFGTKFYTSYGHLPELYDMFSESEDTENFIGNYISEYCVGGQKTILDIGCGTGKYSRKLAPTCKFFYGLDPSDTFLSFAQKKSQKLQLTNVHYLLGKAEQLPFPNQSIDIIIATWAAFPLYETILEMKRVIKSDGIIIRVGACERDDFTSLFPQLNTKTLKANNKWFETNGFTTIYKNIIIDLSHTKKAREILKHTVGVDTKKNKFSHTIAIQTFKIL